MKTIKITEGEHKSLLIIKAAYNLKTIGDAIGFLCCIHNKEILTPRTTKLIKQSCKNKRNRSITKR